MDQNSLLNEQTLSGMRLIEALASDGFEVRIAFWAKLADESRFLFIASPFVDEKGARAAYQRVFNVMRNTPEIWIEPLEIKVLGLNDSLTLGAMAVTKPRESNRPFADRNPRPYPGMTRFGGATLGGVSIDGEAYIYPPSIPSVSA